MNYLFLVYTIIIYLVIYNLRNKSNFFIQLHVGIFAVFVLLFEFVSSFNIKSDYDIITLNIVCIFIVMYCVTALIISNKLNLITYEELSFICSRVDGKMILFSLSPFLLLKLYMMNIYGLYAFNVLSARAFANIPTYIAYFDALLAYPAIGAFYIYIVNLINRNYTKYNAINSLLCFVFIFFYGVFPGGARRFISFLALFVMLLLYYKYKQKIYVKHIFYSMILVVIVLASFEWYQSIRGNIFGIQSKSSIGIIDSYQLLTEKTKVYDTLSENLAERTGPFPLLYDMTSEQINSFVVAEGTVLWQSILNVIPSIFYTEKKYINIDTVLCSTFGYAETDLSTTLLAIIQSELSMLAYIITPLLIIVILKITKKSLNANNNVLYIISIIGFLITLISQVETTLDTILSAMREVFIIYMLSNIINKIIVSLYPKKNIDSLLPNNN